MKNFIKKNQVELITLTIFLILLLVTFLPQAFSGLAFAEGYDIRQQHYPFFEEFRNEWTSFLSFGSFPKIFTNDLPFYSWTSFLGSNFWASKAYYTLGDIYNYLFLPFKALHYFDIRFIQTILKFMIAGLSSYLFLKKFYKTKTALIVGTISYSFSFWIILFMGQPIFITFYSFIPLYFLGMESYLREKKKILFISMCAILLITNYYLYYTLSCLSVAYYIYRYICLGKEKKDFIKETSILIGYYFVGVLMSMVIILPAGLYMLSNNRIGGMEASLIFPNFKIYLNMIHSILSPSYLLAKTSAIEGVFSISNYRYDEIAFFSGILTTLLVPQILTDKDQRFKKATIGLYTFFLIMFIFPFGSSILHGFSEVNFRWLFFVLFMNILITCRYLESMEKINHKNLKITTVISVALLLLLTPFTAFITNRLDEFQTFLAAYQFDIIICVLMAISAVLILKKVKYRKQGLILISCLGIVMFSGHYRLAINESSNWQYIDRRSNGLQSKNKELIQFLRDNNEQVDQMYYRFFVDYQELYAGYSYNSSILYGINDLMAYDSTISPSIYDLEKFKDAGFYDQKWLVNFTNASIVNFLCTEYAVVVDPNILPHNNFELIGDYFGLPVYKNLDVVHFGSTYSKVVTYQDLIDNNENTTDKLLNMIIVDSDKDKDEIATSLKSKVRASLRDVKYYGNSLSGTIDTDNESFMALQLPYDAGWSILVNGKPEKLYRINGGVMGVSVPKGSSYIEMYFVPSGLKLGVTLSIVGFILFGVIIFLDYKKRRK
ncbi:MAG: YfhO family protein [Anaerorhabdus sp.]